MKTICLAISLILGTTFLNAQTVSTRLAVAVKAFEDDPQMKNAILGFYVFDNKTGTEVISRNGNVGLAAASTQKVVTSAAALELLGANYKYKTTFGYNGSVTNKVLNGNIIIAGSGDPTLGSWRYGGTEQTVINSFFRGLKQAGIEKLRGSVIALDNKFESQTIPGGWIWDDIGNYYGAGAGGLNWHENSYDLLLKSGSTNDKISIVGMQPKVPGIELINELQIGKAGIGGSEAYIYLPPYSTQGYLRGKMPPNESSLTIAGSVPNPALFAAQTFAAELEKQKFAANINTIVKRSGADTNFQIMYTHYSPALDSIVYWFLKKSVNLYGEALLKTIAKEMNGLGSTEGGLTVLNNFWKDKGIEAGSLKMLDGSGLSPQNRLTASGLVKVMQYAKSRPWFNAFYTGLPEYNGLKMKSGTIGGAKSFTGYSGDYTFAIIINNYIGSSQALVAKMYKVLDVLK